MPSVQRRISKAAGNIPSKRGSNIEKIVERATEEHDARESKKAAATESH